MTRAELAAQVKAKYPQYAKTEDGALVDAVLAKHPQYAAHLTEEPPSPANPGVPAPVDQPTTAQKVIQFLHDQGPQAIGGGVGAALGTPFGPGPRAGGAMLGGAGGKAVGILNDYATGQRDPNNDTASGNAKEIGLAGLGAGAAEGGMMGLERLAPLAREVGAGGLKIAAGIPEKYGKAVLADPGILNRALPKKVVGEGYDAFERYTGLKSLESQLVAQGRATAPTGELERMVLDPANKAFQGAAQDPQDLYTASQAASRLKLMAKYGEPQAQMAASSAAIGQGKDIAENALEKVYPEYGDLRKQYFESKAKEAFSSLLPRNKGGTVNVLRPVAAATAAAGAGAMAGLPGLGVLAGMSPKAWNTLIRLFPALGKAGEAGVRLGAGEAADSAAEQLP